MGNTQRNQSTSRTIHRDHVQYTQPEQNNEYEITTNSVSKANQSSTVKPFNTEYDAVLKIEYTVHGYNRLHYEEIYDAFVPISIKSIIIIYCGYFFIDSAILNGDEKIILTDSILKNKINDIDSDGIHLLYRASRDGFSEKAFHELCDNKGATIVIIQNSTDDIYGGYSPVQWKSTPRRMPLPGGGTFIFSIMNGKWDNETKVRQKRCEGIFNYTHYGPSFGTNSRNLDIFTCGDCDSNAASHANGIGIKVSTIRDYEVFCLKSEYIEIYKQYTAKLKMMIQQRKQEIEDEKKKYVSMPLPDGVNDEDILSLSDDEDGSNDQEEWNRMLKERETQIRNAINE
eukprot:137563_1